ncbi:MAG TPA: class I SAM-dependent methyltransferase [Chitinophagales bacterium]|nr:class I SAM-dependent methyltransferase [Chitinophagales bacterium]HMU70187.1 class I SAM-dependent methyltransferase [Chitinophagales bacterium]HMX05293.1 class I SAM-dependent methyltransferase [Chitinophagales bacterium]HMZ88833.1 class I SAM-dependent methyltransferase [Chitinophagales bacterium]HNA57081.1 class I SAM-dependent methyltransferase [Chitinophagales bacterium]
MTTIEQIENILQIPDTDKKTPVRVEEAKFIYQFILGHKIHKTLEIGLGYGRSASYIMLATGKPHIAIDPFQSHYGYQAIKNITDAGLKDNFTHIEDFSHFALPELCHKNEKFDFVFIDGDHKFDGILIDYYFASMLVKTGGYILFHDTWMRSTRLVNKFVEQNRHDFKTHPVSLANLHLIQKIQDNDTRDGMYFREFYTTKSWLKYRLITHLNDHPKGLLSKLKSIFRP